MKRHGDHNKSLPLRNRGWIDWIKSQGARRRRYSGGMATHGKKLMTEELMTEGEANDRSNFSGKAVLLTGCTNGIGAAALDELVSLSEETRPSKMILLNRNPELSRQKAELVRQKGIEVSVYIADLSKPEDTLRVIKEIVAGEPELDIAILNAGFWKCLTTNERVVQEDNLEFHYAVNYLQQVLLAEGLAPLMCATAKKKASGDKESRIVVVGSFTAFDISKGELSLDLLRAPEGKHGATMPNDFCYSQSKLAQHVWTKAIVEDQGGIADNVTVNIVCPGGVETNNEVIHLLKRKTGCLYPFIASYVLGQRQPVEGCKPLLCCGGSKVFKNVSGKHLTFGTGGKLVYNAPCDPEFFPQSKWKVCPSIIDKDLRQCLLKDTAEVIQKMKDTYK